MYEKQDTRLFQEHRVQAKLCINQNDFPISQYMKIPSISIDSENDELENKKVGWNFKNSQFGSKR